MNTFEIGQLVRVKPGVSADPDGVSTGDNILVGIVENCDDMYGKDYVMIAYTDETLDNMPSNYVQDCDLAGVAYYLCAYHYNDLEIVNEQ